jgi:hypothetical protein
MFRLKLKRKGKNLLRYCENCNISFKVPISRLTYGRGKHCSKECQYESMRKRAKNKMIERKCIGCGIVFKIKPEILSRKGGGKFCSIECRHRNWKGDITPNWQGGFSNIYGDNWGRKRRKALKRDNYSCKLCGSNKHIQVHHKIPVRLFSDKKYANKLWNLVCLCSHHHRIVESKLKWFDLNTDTTDNLNISCLVFTKDSVSWPHFKTKAHLLEDFHYATSKNGNRL